MEPVVSDPIQLSHQDRDRHERTMALAGFGEQAQGRVQAATVCVIGAGGLGGPVVQYLTAAGVGRLILVDDDVVSLTNLQRQVLFGTSTLGAAKAEAAAKRLADLNPDVEVVPVTSRLTADNAVAVLEDVDVVVDACDNLLTRRIIAQACRQLDRPVVYGSIQAAAGQVTVFWERHGLSLTDLFPDLPDSVPTAAEVGVWGPVTGQVGSIMAAEAIKLITGVGEPLLGRVLYIDALTARVAELPLVGRNGCETR